HPRAIIESKIMIQKFLERLILFTTVIAGAAIALMMLQVSLDVLLRFTVGKGLPGTLTIVSDYYMVIAAFVPLAYAELRKAHIQMELVTDLLPPRLSHRLQGWMLLPTALVVGLLTWRGLEEALKQHAIGASKVQG